MNTFTAYEMNMGQESISRMQSSNRMGFADRESGISFFRSIDRSEHNLPVAEPNSQWTLDLGLLFRISLEYRVLYYFKPFSQESFLSYKGACWCSRERLGGFPYGPGPDDPSLDGSVVRDFFRFHRNFIEQVKPSGRRLDWGMETELNRQCLILGQFEMLMHRGLFACKDLPLFSPRSASVHSLLEELDEDWVWRMSYLSYCFYADYNDVDVDVRGILRQKRDLPLQSPLRRI